MKAFAVLLVVVGMGLSGCKKDSNYFSESSASVGGDGGGSAVGTTGFSVSLRAKTDVDAFMHKFGDIATACEITLAEMSTPTSIQCMLNIMEYDAWFYGFEIEVNVPPGGYCAFLNETPNTFFIARPGIGPASVVINTTDGAIASCTVDGVAGTVATGNCVGNEATFSSAGGLVSCIYDHADTTGSGNNGPNCCAGSGTVVVNATLTSTGDTTTTTTTVPYGGQIYQCTDSAYKYVKDWPKDATTEMALTRVSEVGSGGRKNLIKIASALNLATSGDRRLSNKLYINTNFYDWTAYAANPDTWITNRALPRAIWPTRDFGPSGDNNGTVIGGYGDGSYYFSCRGPAGEVKHEIRMFVNAWNTIEGYEEFATNGDPTAVTPNVYGTASINCSAVNGTGSCNNFYGFDDLINVEGAGVNTAYVFPNDY